MSALVLVALEVGVTFGYVLSVILGLYLWARLRRVGGLELSLAHLVANPALRRHFVWTVGLSFGLFVCAGLSEALSEIFRVGTLENIVTATLLLAGGVCLLVLIAGMLRPSVLTLAEEWYLAETAARASMEAPTLPPPR